MGFAIDDTKLRRAGLDYWPHVDLSVYPSWRAFADRLADNAPDAASGPAIPGRGSGHELLFFTRAADLGLVELEAQWRAATPETPRKVYLVFGSETAGLSSAVEEELVGMGGTAVALPMHRQDLVRCYNLNSSATMALYAAYSALASGTLK